MKPSLSTILRLAPFAPAMMLTTAVSTLNAGMTSADDWISALPHELAAQRALLHRLLAAVTVDQQWDWLELGCSVAEGRGDALSDLDVALGYATADAPPVEVVTALVERLGSVVEVSAQPFEGLPRWWVQYQDGIQLDLVVVSANYRSGRAPGSVALLNRSGRLTDTFTPSLWSAAADDPRNWMLDGWEALANVAKYLHRQSVLEALEQLSRARERVLQLWAIAEQVPYPAFGLVSLLDNPGATLPPAIEATYPLASAADVRTAALTTAELLGMAADRAQPGLATALGPYVICRLHGPR